MIPRPHNPRINDPVRIRGINFYDLALSFASLLVLMMTIGMINVYAEIAGPFTFILLVLIFIGLLIGLKFANKKNHPSYIVSLISFRIFQPKKITHYYQKPGKKTI